jgi:KTSC domain
MNVPRLTASFALFFLFGRLALAEPESPGWSRIPRVRVQSSNVASVGYSQHLQVLEIEFTRGAIYRFLNVRPIVYRELLASQSKGHFIAEYIRDKYAFVRIRPASMVASHHAGSTSVGPWFGE